ncbi:MAG: hypothetical protein A2X08_14925 [Bacteroidetes bacterium GWA2_32_17]|nr:MAG: hypothetical protein A2X08_14925 [Bacteroidetes bacterium GWA2_32_17]
MNKTWLNLLWMILPVIFVTSCKDIVEEDLDGKTVTIIAPANNLQTTTLSHTFWWEEVIGATSYNLQIVDSSFLAINQMVADTNITTNKFTFTLYPGTFQWRVKAINGNSETVYTTYSLKIDSTADLSGQQVVLISPTNSLATNQTTLQFKWYELYNATDYRLEIRSPDWNGSLALNPHIVSGDTISITLIEGFYTWGIQAQNGTSSSLFTTRTLVVDTTRPNTPTLTYPATNDTINDSILTISHLTFRWTRGANSGSTLKDSLFLSTDSVFSTSGNVFKVLVTDTTYTYTMQTANTYFWRIKPLDAAGNIGSISLGKKFIYEK